MANAILRHCREIDRCNQRGGRMLSVVDLLDAGTLTTDLSAYCLAAIGQGASFMVGALPGGAGKTTVMGALLNFVPPDVELAPADGPETIRHALPDRSPRRCWICHEIGPGPYYAYLWGPVLRDYFALAQAGHLLATNLHADTYEQARDQICRQNAVPDSAWRRMNLLLFLSLGPGGRRRIAQAWESDGTQPHQLVYTAGPDPTQPSRLITPAQHAAAAQVIANLRASGGRDIPAVRAFLLKTS